MRKLRYFDVLFISLIAAASVLAEDKVEIYSDYSVQEFGRAPKRVSVLSVPLREFSATRTNAVSDPDGVLTAVVLDAKVVDALYRFLDGFHERWLDPAWFWIDDAALGRRIINYYDNGSGLRFSFSAEKPGKEMLRLIDAFYARDAKNRLEVRKSYEDNYVLRIHSAENIRDPWKDEISFEEVLLTASLIGDRDQPLWGVRDGFGLLKDFPARIQEKLHLRLDNYRPITDHEDSYLAFIGKINAMTGDFPRNLRYEAMSRIETNSSYEFQLPENLLERGKGHGRDLVLLYYDVLTRKGFQVKVLAVKGKDKEEPEYFALYRPGTKGNWGVLTAKDLFSDQGEEWKRIPEALAGPDAVFAELEPRAIFAAKKPLLPAQRDWKTGGN